MYDEYLTKSGSISENTSVAALSFIYLDWLQLQLGLKMFSSCLKRERTPQQSQKWYHQPETPYTGYRSGRYYQSDTKKLNNKARTDYSVTMNLGKTNITSSISPSSVLDTDKKISAFYNQRSLIKEVEIVESQEKQLNRLRQQNQELRKTVKQLTPIKDKYNRLRQQYLKKEKEIQLLQMRVSELERFRRVNS